VRGFEISSEAVAYAGRTFREASFEQRALSTNTDLGVQFDLVLAQEFYPFTRTGDFTVHSRWLEMLIHHLTPGGIALIVLSERDAATSILANLDRAEALCHATGMTLRHQRLPFDRVYHHLPVLWMSRLASAALACAGYHRISTITIS
jgi:hypothetical protein